MKVILASGSPRRKELLKLLFNEFEIRVSNAEEKVDESLPPEEVVMSLASQKGRAVHSTADELLIAADTVVASGGHILGKPHDRDDAVRMITMLSGKTHSVYTGVYLRYNNKEKIFYEKTDVVFLDLTPEEISAYVATGEADDKAGSYGIQGKGGLLVERISGDYNNVVGFPVSRINRELKDFL